MSATYGDLVGKAGVDIHTGLLRVMRRGFVDERQAANTVGAYYDLIAALRSHTWRLLDPLRVRTIDLIDAGADLAREDFDAVAVRTFQAFGPLRERPTWLPYPDADFDHPWRDAADKLGAAADLLDTHLGRDGRALSEQADVVADVHLRRGAVGFIAQLTALTVGADAAIGAACRHRDIPWDQVNRWLPDRAATKDLVGRLHEMAAKYDQHPGLRNVAVNVYPVREGDPLLELGDRMLRLRHAAWGLAGADPDYSVVTLHDLAGLGMTVNLHTAAAHGIDLTAHVPAPHRLVATAHAYMRLTGDLRDYVAPGPPDRAIRTDVVAACRLLAELAPANRPGFSGVARDDAVSAFANGTGVFMVEGTWEAPPIIKVNPTGFGFFAVPPGASGKNVAQGSMGMGWHITASSKNLTADVAWIAMLLDPKNAGTFVDNGRVPTLADGVSASNSLAQDTITASAQILKSGGNTYSFDWATSTMDQTMGGAIQGVMAGQVQPDAALHKIQDDWSAFQSSRQ